MAIAPELPYHSTTRTRSEPRTQVPPYSQARSQPLLRLRLAPHGALPRAIDGAWWPYSYDVLAELPGLLAGLPPQWGPIGNVTVNGAMWTEPPGRMVVAGQPVRLHRNLASSLPHTVVLLAPGRGRWDLVVVEPEASPESAALLMAAAAGGQS
ncbi:DUF5994 family protein [Streptomyces sp. NPDC029674]|uniref:DUF5994 family protein n=1 Tax=Streptomyces sp. NPDC029674 TaxID=3365297 RepID=UPI00385080E2